ncbi:5-hydroxytryptamine receptor 1A-like [Ylistrum balloti]|uniref:5-hydroxytryptamine receptor 1A-like n=1 Tax=Ylistrum balloti TaxID=509963 RepID=UPI002905D2E7|nr:5-hydroxytryptamine receptor 1A-like [Ylistrum balloti]
MANDTTRIAASTLLWFANEKEVEIYIPAIFFASSMMILGLVGNGFVFYVYGYRFKKTCASVYIYWLSVFDLVCCTVCIPFEIFEIRFPFLYEDIISCKFFSTVATVAYVSQCLLLLCISRDRYYKICHPLKTFAVRSPHKNIFYTFILALFISWPTSFLYGTKTIEMAIPGIVTTTCSIDDSRNQLLIKLYYGFYAVIVIGSFFFLVFVYTRIIRVVYNRSRNNIGEAMKVKFAKKNVRSYDLQSKANQNTRDVFVLKCSERFSQHVENEHLSETKYSKCLDDNELKRKSRNTLNISNDFMTPTEQVPQANIEQIKELDIKRRFQISKTAIIFIAVTVSFMFSYIPYLVIEIILKYSEMDFRKQNIHVQQLIEVASKSFCLNNATNPIIYSIFNRNFRRECCRLFSRQVGPVRNMLSLPRVPVSNIGRVSTSNDSDVREVKLGQ